MSRQAAKPEAQIVSIRRERRARSSTDVTLHYATIRFATHACSPIDIESKIPEYVWSQLRAAGVPVLPLESPGGKWRRHRGTVNATRAGATRYLVEVAERLAAIVERVEGGG